MENTKYNVACIKKIKKHSILEVLEVVAEQIPKYVITGKKETYWEK